MGRLLVICAVLLWGAAGAASAGTRVVAKETMSFEACIATIQHVATQLGTAPINIVETNILRMVRFKTNDGSGKSVLVTCSAPDRKMVINESW